MMCFYPTTVLLFLIWATVSNADCDSPCDSGKLCRLDQCQAACSDASDCASEDCIKGFCSADCINVDADTCGDTCTSDDDCEVDETDLGLVCFTATDTARCTEKAIIDHPTDLPGEGHCENDGDCDDGEVCRIGVCYLECTADEDCNETECINGSCSGFCPVDPESGKCGLSCTPDGDECGADHACTDKHHGDDEPFICVEKGLVNSGFFPSISSVVVMTVGASYLFF